MSTHSNQGRTKEHCRDQHHQTTHEERGMALNQPDEPVNLSAERNNPVIGWDEFSGDFQ